VTPNFFSTLGVQPSLGRDFLPQEDLPSAPHAAIISYGFWRSQFGGRADVIGSTIRLNGQPYALIGVLPRNFEFLIQDVQVWVPLVFAEEELSMTKTAILGRMQPGVTIRQADREMAVISKRLETKFPDYKNWGAMVVSFRDMMGPNVRPAVTALLIAA